MNLYVGIDIGGTYTDYAVIDDSKLLLGGKLKNQENSLKALEDAINLILKEIPAEKIARINISTTTITNFIASKKYSFPEFLIMPGPGINPKFLPIPEPMHILDAAIDFRGREIVPLTQNDQLILRKQKSEKIAVIGKFSGRNPAHELLAEKMLKSVNPHAQIYLGHKISSALNFPRRINTTLFYAATKDVFQEFINTVKDILSTYKVLLSKTYLLLSNGSLVNIYDESINPAQTVLSGPVGSVLGAKAISNLPTFISLDIGGTTSDFALVLDNVPLYADKGIYLNNLPTAITAFAVYSVPIGGDTPVNPKTGELGDKRIDSAVAFGGQTPTLTDAFNIIGTTNAGNYNLSKKVLGLKQAQSASHQALEILLSAINNIFTSWQNEPAYHIWEIKQKTKNLPNVLIPLGGAAQGLPQLLGKSLGLDIKYFNNFQIANAIGTALVKPTVSVSLYADTKLKKAYYLEKGMQIEKIPPNSEEMLKIATAFAQDEFKRVFTESAYTDITVIENEQYNIIRGFTTEGKILSTKTIIPADVVTKVDK